MSKTSAPPRLREVAPHVVALLSITVLYKSLPLGGALLIGLVLALAYLRAKTPTFIWQFIYALGGGAAAYALARVLDGRLQVEFGALFLGAALARLPLSAPAMRGRLDSVILAATMVALGASREPPKAEYITLSAAFVAALMMSAGEASPLRILKDHPGAAALVLLLGGGLAAALGYYTPRLTGVGPLLMGHVGRRTGFTGRVRLGEGGAIETSDDTVMRIRGGHVDYLRGAVMDKFDRDAWLTSRVRSKILGSARGPITVTMGMPTTYLFAPQGGAGLSDGAEIDAYGVTTVGIGVPEYTIDPAGGVEPDPPEARDTEISAPHPRITALAQTIVGGETDDRARVALLSRYLATNYRYTLARTHARKEPSAILDFLFANKEGHCEFFASALALLARSLGIPARVVAGYRVVEHNPYGDYDVVRSKNAHAWVELWDERTASWRTEDPTPPTEAMQPREGDGLRALLDAVREKARVLGQALGERPALLLGALAMLTLLLVARRFFKRGARAASLVASDASILRFREVSEALAARGLRREPWEGVETFAARVREAGDADAARVLVRYSEVRYDPNAGAEEAALADELTGLLERLRRPPPTSREPA